MSLRAIIFDMDGVICDSEPLHMQAFQRVLTEESIHISDQEYYDRYLAHDDRGSFTAAFRDNGRPGPDTDKMKNLLIRKGRYFDEFMKNGLVIYPGSEAFARKVSHYYPLALATGARRLEVDFILKKAKIRDIFTAIVCADDVKNGKPEPESFELALKHLNRMRLDATPEIHASDVLVIEDSPRCIKSAKALGMKTVGLATSYPAAQLAEADRVLESLMAFEVADAEKLFA